MQTVLVQLVERRTQ